MLLLIKCYALYLNQFYASSTETLDHLHVAINQQINQANTPHYRPTLRGAIPR